MEYFLNPGELIFSKEPMVIKTVLGSCVAVTIFDKVNRWGGMCHYLLPIAPANLKSTKYGDVAIKYLIKKFIDNGSDIKNLEATITGGAFIIFSAREIFFVGDRNVDVAENILRERKVYIKYRNTGGENGRKVVFSTEYNVINVEIIKEIRVEDLYRDGKVV